jgi:hypothetical protein
MTEPKHTATALLPHPVERCWRAFIDVTMLPAWVPGLRRARVIRADAAGLPLEVSFEFGDTLSYTLEYSYAAAQQAAGATTADEHVIGSHARLDARWREVRWSPRVGRRDGVSGRARFEPEGDSCRVHYELEPAGRHSSRERELASEDSQRLLDAFVAWIGHQR